MAVLTVNIFIFSQSNDDRFVNKVFFIGNEKCKIVGNITMDSFVLDITDVKKNKLNEGDHICLLDNSNIQHILKNNNIISYELLTLMGDRLHRNY